LRSGTNPRVRLNSLEQTISSLEQDINNLNVADNYRLIEQQADEETQKMRNLEKDIAILKFQITEVEKSMQDTPDITNEQLLQMYSGLKMIFKQEALEHFDSVERFHFSLAKRRKQYLERDKQKLLLEKQEKEMSYEQVSQVRDSYLKQLEGKKALDDYSVLVNELAKLKEEKNRLLEYVNFEDINNSAKLSIKSQITLNDENANEYTNREPLYEYDRMFRVLSSMLYPHHDAGIILENNTGFNQQKFNLIVQIQGHDSDGINEARIVLYDWLLLTKGINHHMKFLWHDSRLFANIDEFARARWFEYVLEEAKQQDKQYIATINTENYETTYATLTEEKRQLLDEAVCLELTQDNNLLGKTLTN
jgi:uncharacterized protein YydD (DUF2326 family)